MTTANAQCLCGDISPQATLPSKWVAHCHCSLCRRAHGAALVTWVGMEASRCSIDDPVTALALVHLDHGRRTRLLRPLRQHAFLPLGEVAGGAAHRTGPLHHARGPHAAGACVLGRPCLLGRRGSSRWPAAKIAGPDATRIKWTTPSSPDSLIGHHCHLLRLGR